MNDPVSAIRFWRKVEVIAYLSIIPSGLVGCWLDLPSEWYPLCFVPSAVALLIPWYGFNTIRCPKCGKRFIGSMWLASQGLRVWFIKKVRVLWVFWIDEDEKQSME